MISIHQMSVKQIAIASVTVLLAGFMSVSFYRTGNVFKFFKAPVSQTVATEKDTEGKAAEAKKAYEEASESAKLADKALLDAKFRYVEAEKKRKREAESAAGRDNTRVRKVGANARRLRFD